MAWHCHDCEDCQGSVSEDESIVTISDKIAGLLFHALSDDTSKSVTKLSPAKLLLGRYLRGRLNFLHPNLADRVEKAAEKQNEYHDVHTKERKLQAGSKVYARKGWKMEVEEGRDSEVYGADVIYSTAGGRNILPQTSGSAESFLKSRTKFSGIERKTLILVSRC